VGPMIECKLNSLTPTLTLVEVPSDYPIEYAHQLRTQTNPAVPRMYNNICHFLPRRSNTQQSPPPSK
jgi:hypothetical protein